MPRHVPKVEMNGKFTLAFYAKLVACATVILLFAGGLVTSTGSGLSVPDWPLSFGTFFPRMRGGVVFEHTHRMIAGTVVLLTLCLVVWIFREEKRKSVKIIGAAAMGTILAQAILGGMTVLFKLPPAVSVAHAGVAQIFFCLIVTLAVLTSHFWQSEPPDPDDSWLRGLTIGATGIIYLQILVGAVIRHLGAGLAIPDFPLAFGRLIPPARDLTLPVALNVLHRTGAVLISGLIFSIFFRAFSVGNQSNRVKSVAFLALGIFAIQFFLGASILWTRRSVIPTTAHVVVGGILLATSLTLTLLAWKGRLQGVRGVCESSRKVESA